MPDLSSDDMRKRVAAIDRLKKRFDELPTIRMTEAAFKALPEYSCSEPTGIQHGKRWRRHDGAHDRACPRECVLWVVCEYEVVRKNPDGTVTYLTHWYRPVIQGESMPALIGAVAPLEAALV